MLERSTRRNKHLSFSPTGTADTMSTPSLQAAPTIPGRTRHHVNGSPHRLRTVSLLSVALVLSAASADARITRTGPIVVHVLLDNSGSMYPGYQPAGGVGMRGLGVRLYREYPWFRDWLQDFVERQSVLNAQTVEMSAFTSGTQFHPGDVRQVHVQVPLARLDAGAALDRVTGWGQRTFLAESLNTVSRGFEGLVWLITDNIVETGGGTPDLEVKRFFETLRDTPRYRSVHLFKLPFEEPDARLRSALAVYGILVSDQEIDDTTAAFYDRKFRDTFRTATRGRGPGGPLFLGHEHLKLKDLDVAPFDLQFDPTIEVENLEKDRVLGREGRKAEIRLEGTIQSNLTQHSVTSGRYELRVVTPFEPDAEARKVFGLGPIPPGAFEPAAGTLAEVIPPTSSSPVEAVIRSRERIGLDTSGFLAWLRAAFSGLTAEYEGEVEMVFEDVEARFERDRLAGVFGADVAPEVFDFEDVQTIQASPERDRIRMKVTSAPSRGFILLVILAVLTLLGVAAARTFLRRERYRVTVGDSQNVAVLTPLGSHEVRHGRWRFGRIKRGFGSGYEFVPARDDREVEVEPGGQEGHFQARIREVGSVPIWIERLGGKAAAAEGSSSAKGGRIRRPDTAVGAAGPGAPNTAQPPAPKPGGARTKAPPPIRRPGS